MNTKIGNSDRKLLRAVEKGERDGDSSVTTIATEMDASPEHIATRLENLKSLGFVKKTEGDESTEGWSLTKEGKALGK